MAKSKLQKLTELFDSGNLPIEDLEEVDFDTSTLKSLRLVPIDSDLLRQFEVDAKSKRMSLAKIINSFIRKNLSKAA